MTRLRVAVTGTSGFLGSALTGYLAARGAEVRALGRDPAAVRAAAPAATSVHEFAFCGALDESGVDGADVLVHCAWQARFHNAAEGDRVNREGSLRLFEVCERLGVPRIVYVSSMSVHEEAESTYARTKRALEMSLDPERHLVVRPGHIVGEGGVFWRAVLAIARLPVVPLFFGGEQRIQTVGIDDVCRGLLVALEKDLRGTLFLATPEPVSIRGLYERIAARLGKRRILVRVPGAPALAAVRWLEARGIPTPVTTDNLLGIRNLRIFDLSRDLDRLGFVPRGVDESLAAVDWSKARRR